ncbi:hypothetical protein K435DRAFT_838965 [Dendrothele bispora CBS 962.96]|uniref:Uncharacterized protein n=1 Tax=Dendrothele bispora (strain CBS 962.96) TaxID=1314807 RepID=A0A4S8M3M0_DENBC|nr:hypothetical protein K435DRAFT_838965 [Dendrothele bispora CBS 962.96]
MPSNTYRHRPDDYTINSLSNFSFGNPATPAHRLEDNEVGPTDVTPRPSVIAPPVHTPSSRHRDGTDVEFSSDDDHDIYDYDEEAMKIEVSSARFSDGRRASMPSEDLLYERERGDSVGTLRRNSSAFHQTATSISVSAPRANNNNEDVGFDLAYITSGIADGSPTVLDFVRRPSAISLAPSSATPRGSAGQQSFFWSWGGLGLRRPSTVTVATNSSGGGTSAIFQHDDSFARRLNNWGGENYREQRKDWTFHRDPRADKMFHNIPTSSASTSSGATLFGARPTTADRETDKKNRLPANWKGMQIGSEEVWRNDSVGSFMVQREEVGRKPEQADAIKGPQQRLLIRDIRHRETGARPEHPPVVVHKHSKTMAFSISRYYKSASSHLHSPSSVAGSPRPSTVVSRGHTTAPSQAQQPRSSRIVLLAPRRVQEAFTSTRTTGMLADYGLLGGDGEREKRHREREREKARKEKEKREKGKAKEKDKDKDKDKDRDKDKDKGKEKEKEKDLTGKEKERRKSVLGGGGKKKISSQPSSSNLKDSDRGTKSEGFVVSETRRPEGGPSDSSDAFDEVGVMSAPERLRPPSSSATSSASGHGYGPGSQPPMPILPHPPNGPSMPYDSSASASSTTSLQSSSASTSTSTSNVATTPSSSAYPQRHHPPPSVIRKHRSYRRPYDHEHDGYYQDWEDNDDEYDDDEEMNDDDYDGYGLDHDHGDLLNPRRFPRRRRRPSRTPHSETYGTVDVSQFNALQKQFKNNSHLTYTQSYEGKLSLFDRLTGRSNRVTGKVSTKGVSARDGVLRAGGAGASFEPPWVTFPSRGKQEEHKKMINSLNSSFQDVGLLPSVPRDMRGKDSRSWAGSGKEMRKKDKDRVKSRDRRDASEASITSDTKSSDPDAEEYDVFENIPSDSLYMLLPLWPGDTDGPSARDHPHRRLNLPIEKRMFLLVCYKEIVPEPPTPSSATTSSGVSIGTDSESATGHKKPPPTSSWEKKDDKNILLPGFIITARQVSYADLQGSGVRVPDEGLTVFGPLEEAINEMPGKTGLEGYDTSNFIWGVTEGDPQNPTADSDMGESGTILPPDEKTIRMLDTIVGVCHSREAGIEFDPEALIALGLAKVLNPLPRGKIAEEVEEEQRQMAMRRKLTPVGKAVVQMIWVGGLALTSFGPI